MLLSYQTIKGEAEHELIIQRSRFISHVKRAETEDEALLFIQMLKKKYWDASHNCSAYQIGEQNMIQKANDDGEPAGTAGLPILDVIRKKELKDTVIVVTRYFGGTKLGTGGLIRAYGSAASSVIMSAGISERRWTRIIHTTIDYSLLGKVENELRQSSYTIKEIHYLDQVTVETYVPEQMICLFCDWMIDLTNGQAVVQEGEALYLDYHL